MEIRSFIDATLLKATTTEKEIEALCLQAVKERVCSVCISPQFVSLAADLLSNTSVKVCTVIGFPLGNTSTRAKVSEADIAIKDGAQEIDMVIQQGEFLSGNFEVVEHDIKEVVSVAVSNKVLVKVILECANLPSDELKKKAADIAVTAGANFVKTSTGFAASGATVADIKLLKSVVPSSVGIKASGGIRNRQFAQELIDAGATRIGTSSMKEILHGGEGEGY